MTTDCELLRQYVEAGNETAFAEVLGRHLNMVYASAIWLLNNDAHLAEDVTQAVFTDLARKAATLAQHESVAGWLYRSTRFAAKNAIRTEQRRRTREHEAHVMSDNSPTYEAAWLQLRPLIDEALMQLKESEREAVLLRFFEERSHREVGAALGLTEGAAQMRVDRAMDKLRAYFVRHGVNTTVALLATTLGAQAAGTPAPAALAANIAGKSLADAAAAGPATGVWTRNIIPTKKPSLLAGTVAVAATGIFAATYFSLLQPRVTTTKAISAITPPAPVITLSTPAPNMNTPKILTAAVLSAAIISTSATAATAADQTPPASQQDTSSANEQTEVNPSSANSTSSASQSPSAPDVKANSSSDTQVPVTPAPPGIGIAIWDRKLGPSSLDGRGPNYVKYESAPHLVDMSGVLKGKTITAVSGWGGWGGERDGDHLDGDWAAVCSDGTVARWGPMPHWPDNRIANGALDNISALMTPTLMPTNPQMRGKKPAMVGARYEGDFIQYTDGSVYRNGGDLGGRITKIVSCGGYFIAIRRDGTLSAGGFDEMGCMGIGPKMNSTIAGQHVTLEHVYTGGVLQGKTVIDIDADGLQGLALCSDGTLAHWGARVVPGMYELGMQADNIQFSTSELKKNQPGFLRTFGDRGVNELNTKNFPFSLGSLDDRYFFGYSDIPIRVLDETGVLKGKTVTALAHASGHILVLCSDGTVAAWGGEVAPLSDDTQTNIYERGSAPPFNQPPDMPATAYPIFVSGTGALAGKTVTAITDEGLMLCSDNTLVQWHGDSAPVTVNLGAIKGRTIVSIAPGAVVFK